MGYVHIPGSNQFTVNSPMNGVKTITNVATDVPLVGMSMPDYKGKLIQATMEVFINTLKDTSGAENYNDGAQNIQISTSKSGGYQNAVYIQDGALRVAANDINGNYRLYGDYLFDIKSYLGPGEVLAFKWDNAEALGNNLLAYGMYILIHCNFR